jgi:Poly(ADP-ribose) polymerase catalytic domain
MFGPGVYFTNVSSKADGYSGNTDNKLRTRVMIVNRVALGLSKIMHEASQEMQHAPSLFNSVSGSSESAAFRF